MASKEFITKRIAGKKAEIEKLTKKLERIEKAESSNWENNPYFYSESDKRYTLKDLENAKKALESYQKDLQICNEKEASRDVKVILEFLDMWKTRNHDFYMEAMTEFVASWNELKELDDQIEKTGRYTEEGKQLAKIWEEKSKQHHINLSGVWEYQTRPRYNFKREQVGTEKVHVQIEAGRWEYASRYLDRNLAAGEAKLNADLNEEANRKYDFIIERTNEIVGTITDASNLRIGAKGDLNGYVIGTKGNAVVQTIGAGGYNIQCFHFRTLVRELKRNLKAESKPQITSDTNFKGMSIEELKDICTKLGAECKVYDNEAIYRMRLVMAIKKAL